tara:strand:+ start:58 stop:405 length:348 start_codon:yes stop_codon:yes gene_type:complete
MAVAVIDHQRDGELCTVTYRVSNNGNASTTANVIGHVTQFALNNVTGSGVDPFTVKLEDTENNYLLFEENNKSADETLDSFRNGGGGYCRGPLKLTVTNHAGSITFNVIVYYTRM